MKLRLKKDIQVAMVLEVESVSKKFKVSRNRPLTLKESVIRRLKGNQDSDSVIWALRDVSFSVKEGEAVGIIGHNGAGKTTLLRLLCGLGRPTSGQIRILGQISGLLELGGCFHLDMTGRENIMTSGVLNGLTKKEVRAREQEIITFAELEDFIDQPVRTYSSGMYLRLAFSSAIFCDPDVLIIDEVLAVGDVSFQQKCVKKLSSFRKNGKTLILTSHDTDQIQKTCDVVIVLDEGNLVMQDEPHNAIQYYYKLMNQRNQSRAALIYGEDQLPNLETESGARLGTQEVGINSVQFYNSLRNPTTSIRSGESLTIELKYRITKPVSDFALVIGIYSELDVKCFETIVPSIKASFGTPDESTSMICHLSELPLIEGCYYINVGIYPTNWDFIYDYHFQMHPLYVTSRNGTNSQGLSGILSLNPEWSIKSL